MALRSNGVQDIADAVLGCVCVALDQVAAADPLQPGCPDCRACVVPGKPAWDDCSNPCSGDGAGGQLTVSVGRTYMSTVFPADDRTVIGVKKCTPPADLAVEIIVTLLRCAPGDDVAGCPPSCEDLAAAARIAHIDLVTIINALLCCLPGTSTGRADRRFVLGAGQLLGPEGGCVGVEQRLTVALPNCYPCPEVTP